MKITLKPENESEALWIGAPSVTWSNVFEFSLCGAFVVLIDGKTLRVEELRKNMIIDKNRLIGKLTTAIEDVRGHQPGQPGPPEDCVKVSETVPEGNPPT